MNEDDFALKFLLLPFT